MKKQLLKSALMAVAGVGLLAGSAMADYINNIVNPLPPPSTGEPSISSLISGYGLDPITDQTGNALWVVADVAFPGSVAQAAVFEVAYFGGIGSFGIYDPNGGEEYTFLITNPVNTPIAQKAFFGFLNGNLVVGDDIVTNTGTWSGTFGLYFKDSSGTTYSEDSKAGVSKMLTYKLPATLLGSDGNNDWLLAFDRSAGPVDYNDALIGLRDASPVPEPATMLLFGTGIAGLAGIARRKTAGNI